MTINWNTGTPTDPGTYLKHEAGRTVVIELLRGDWQSRQNPEWLYTSLGELITGEEPVAAVPVAWYGPIPPVPTAFGVMEDDS